MLHTDDGHAVTQSHTTNIHGILRVLSGSTPEGAILSHKAVPAYVWAGQAEFTVVSPKTGARYTYQVRAPRRSKDGTQRFTREQSVDSPLRFVHVVDDGAHFLGTCYLQDGPDGGTQVRRYVHSQERSRLPADDEAVKVAQWMLENLHRLPLGLEVWHLGRCARCGRKLSVPESLTSGIGPDCAEQMQKRTV